MAKTILIADDDPNMRSTLADILAGLGYLVVEAGSGQEALDKAREAKPEVALLDTRLPDMDGNALCQQIKKIEGLNVKVIVYTGYIDAVNAGKARAAGADDYVVKTSDLALLLGAIKNLTGNQ